MFFIFSKILSFLISPFYWIILLTLTYLYFRKKKKWVKKLPKIILVIFIIGTNRFIALEFIRFWEPEGTKIEDVRHYDVGIVLTGMADYNNELKRLSVRRGSDRLWQALRLYRKGKIDKILISGSNGNLTSSNLNEADQFREILIEFGIPEEDIIAENISKNTHENAVETSQILKNGKYKNGDFLLITSALHMPRAKACFEKEGLEFDTFTTDHFTGKFYMNWEHLLIPSFDGFEYWRKFNHEVIGYISYWMAGYI